MRSDIKNINQQEIKNKLRLMDIVVNEGLLDIVSNKNKFGVSRSLLEIIISYTSYENVFDEIRAGFLRDYSKDLPGYSFARGVIFAAWGNHKKLLEYFMNDNSWELTWGYCLVGAARGGHLDLVKEYIDKGSNEIEFAIVDASFYGHQHIVKYLLPRHKLCSSWALYGAARGGHLDLVEYLMTFGAQHPCMKANNGKNHLEMGLTGAIHGNHKDLVEYFYEKNPTLRPDTEYLRKDGYNRITVESIR